ncbi:hypothetical protein MLD38_022214 [Melastoma candidum]|uniref:Uncharacterized protein n=1 Tax=Melastoma candidum TaxID=119954 RepID=A0ACB9QKD4_9MYRT|nr:hypothetical protein MLD38_022214 [Melastoma candidum]
MPTTWCHGGKCSKIRHIVRLRQMLLRWRDKASSPTDVPSGHVAVQVGPERQRFIVRAAHLNHPIFRGLLKQAEEEFGFDVQGPITIPCDVAQFEDAIQYMARSESGRGLGQHQHRRYCHVWLTGGWCGAGEGRPLLQGLAG